MRARGPRAWRSEQGRNEVWSRGVQDAKTPLTPLLSEILCGVPGDLALRTQDRGCPLLALGIHDLHPQSPTMPQGLPGSEESHSALQMKRGYPRAGKKAHSLCPHPQARVAPEFPLAGPFSSV